MKNKILIIGGDSEQAASLETSLSAADYDFQTADSENIAAVTRQSAVPDLIITFAAEIPEAVKSIAATDQNWRTVPFLLLGTAPELGAANAEALRERETDYFHIPFNPLCLTTQIARLIERERMKKILRKKDFRFLALIENSTDLIVVLAPDGTILYESPSARQILGREPQTNLNVNAFDFVHPEDRSRVIAHLKNAVPNPPSNAFIEYRYRHRNGAWCLLESVGRTVEDPTKGKVIVINSRDITESRIAESENFRLNTKIEDQRQRLNAIIANVPGIVWESTLSADNSSQFINFISDYVEKVTGYTVEECLSKPNFWLNIMHPEDRAHAELETASLFENKRVSVQQFRWITKDGKVIWMETQMALIRDADGSVTSLRGISTDVSERKAIEEALQKSEEQLRQSQKLESVGRLAGGIAHDFNNMLTAINGYSDLILRELSDSDSIRKKVLEIKKAGERSSALTHQLLAFSRRQVLQPKLIDLNKIVSEMSQMLHRLIGEDVQLNIALSEQPSWVEADPGQLSQVIMNLVVNARDALPQGGEITIKTEKVTFADEPVARYAPPTEEPFVLLRVIDCGTGIDEKTLKHIFEPFYTTKQSGVGTGLGLATVYGIVKQSGGYIWVNSELGKGADFRVYLPQAEEKNAGRKEKKRVEQFPHGTETILLVEDEEMVRDLTRRILELCDYNVIEARNGIEALKLAAQTDRRIDLLMTDVVMPQMNGRELSEKLREIGLPMRTLFTSGYMNDRLMQNGISVEDVNFIQKPFAPDVLARKIRETLDRED